MEVKVEKLPKSTLKISIKTGKDSVEKTYLAVILELAKTADVSGFRKGKAPIDLVEKGLDQGKLNGEVVNRLLQEFYVAALKEHRVNPIGNPKVEIQKFARGEDFEFEATVATRPEVKIGDYKDKLKTVLLKKNLEDKESKDKPKLSIDEVIEAISETTEVEVPDLLVEEEVTRMLSRLLSQTESLGLTVEQYMTAQNKSIESLREEYSKSAAKSLKAEFALSKAIEMEGIKVEEPEIKEAINGIPDEKAREQLKSGADRWYIIGILAKNKLIKKLMDELEDK